MLANQKAAIHKLCKRYPQNDSYKNELKNLSRLVTRQARTDKKVYYDKYLSECGHGTRKYWQAINTELGRGVKPKIGSLLVNGAELYVDGNENHFNRYFCGVVAGLSAKNGNPAPDNFGFFWSVFSKIFEILVKKRILSFLLKNNYFSVR